MARKKANYSRLYNSNIMQTYQLTPGGLLPFPTSTATPDDFSRSLPAGLYTTFRTYANGSRVFGLRAHLARLFGPIAAMGIKPLVSEEQTRALLHEACSRQPGESRLRLVLTTAGSPGAVFLSIEPFQSLPEALYRQGVRVASVEVHRQTPRLKTTAFISASQQARTLIGGEIHEVLLCQKGRVLEGMTSNFYALQGKTLITARRGILLGVTRRIVLRLARMGEGLDVDYRPPHLQEQFDETWITSSSRGVLPVVAIDGKPVGEGRPGEMAKRLRAAYESYVLSRAEPFLANKKLPGG